MRLFKSRLRKKIEQRRIELVKANMKLNDERKTNTVRGPEYFHSWAMEVDNNRVIKELTKLLH